MKNPIEKLEKDGYEREKINDIEEIPEDYNEESKLLVEDILEKKGCAIIWVR